MSIYRSVSQDVGHQGLISYPACWGSSSRLVRVGSYGVEEGFPGVSLASSSLWGTCICYLAQRVEDHDSQFIFGGGLSAEGE